jgi:alkylated DNA repair protein (DNA oxidative demethylase)
MTRLIGREPAVVAPGAVHIPDWLDVEGQRRLVLACQRWAEDAGGFRRPRMPNGGVMSVGITCLGWHWLPYRYSPTVDDGDGRPVAPLPEWLADLSRRAVVDAFRIDPTIVDSEAAESASAAGGYEPDVALVNWYATGARMGMHADRDEQCRAPVVSLSLGETCVFRFGHATGRGRPWADVQLESGDLFVFGGPSRLAFHGVPKLVSGTGDVRIGPDGGRFNVTVRQSGLTRADAAGQAGRPSTTFPRRKR